MKAHAFHGSVPWALASAPRMRRPKAKSLLSIAAGRTVSRAGQCRCSQRGELTGPGASR